MPLYKYTKSDRLEIFQNLEIRFTQPGALNDPFELRPRFEALIAEAELLSYMGANPIEVGDSLRQAYEMLPEESRKSMPFDAYVGQVEAALKSSEGQTSFWQTIALFIKSMYDYTPLMREKLFEALNSNLGILSLSEVPDNTLMWSHYGDSHRGIVIEFDEMHSFFNRKRSDYDECYHLRKVVYADSPPLTSMTQLKGEQVLVTKAESWSYEREWRMLVPLKDAVRVIDVPGDKVYLFPVAPQAIRRVILGALTNPEAEKAICDLLKSSEQLQDVKVSRAVLDQDTRCIRIT